MLKDDHKMQHLGISKKSSALVSIKRDAVI